MQCVAVAAVVACIIDIEDDELNNDDGRVLFLFEKKVDRDDQFLVFVPKLINHTKYAYFQDCL